MSGRGSGFATGGGGNPHPAPCKDIFQRQQGYEIQIAGGASSSRSAGDAAAGPSGTPGGGVGRSRPDLISGLTRERASPCAPAGPRISSDARSGLPPSAEGADLVTIHITLDTSWLLMLLAAEHGDSLGGMAARLTAAEIERNGGIASLAAHMPPAKGRKGKRPSRGVARAAAAPAAEGGDTAREAEETGGIARV